MGKHSTSWPLHRVKTLMLFKKAGIGVTVTAASIVQAHLERGWLGAIKVMTLYKDLYSLYECGYIKPVDTGGKFSAYTLTKAGADQADFITEFLLSFD